MDLPSFVTGEDETTSALESPAQEPAANPAPEPKQEPTPEPAPEPQPASQEPEPAPQPAPELHAPLAALLDEREKRQTAERRARELEEWRAQQEAQARAQPIPDRYEDPEGYEAAQQHAIQAALFEQKREFSKRIAEIQFGAETVQAAHQWGFERCAQDPFFNQKVASSPDPYALVVAEWKREQLLTRVDPTKLEQFEAWLATQNASPTPTPTAGATQPPARPAAPRASIAAAPSASSTSTPMPKDGEEAYRQMFGAG